MKKLIFGLILSTLILSGCSKETPKEENHQQHHHHSEGEDMQTEEKATPDFSLVKVDNEIDPICEMTTADHLNDTLHYKEKIYGFCSSHCKKEFKKNPEKYAIK